MKASFRLGRIGGVDVGVHYTWIFAFILITWSLAVGAFPQFFPDWTETTYWVAGVLSSLLLFASVLVHELAHSFVAIAKGLRVRGITLFIFGGVSNIEEQSKRAVDEFHISIVGPLTSLALGVLFFALFWWLTPEITQENIFEVLQQADVIAGMAFYLGWINILLGVFNLVPGFPLDGGRVLRSILWGATGSLSRATNIAATVGQGVAWLLIGFGIVQVLAGNLLGGVWIALIGWFLNTAAGATKQEMAVQSRFEGVRVADVMDARPECVEPYTSVDVLVREHFLRRGKRAAPVLDGDALIGIVTLTDVRELNERDWPMSRVRDIMTRMPLHMTRPEDSVDMALKMLAEHDLNQLIVLDNGGVAGVVSREGIVRFLSLSQELRMETREARSRRNG